MMDILMSETCWAHKKWNKRASVIKLVFYSSANSKYLIKDPYISGDGVNEWEKWINHKVTWNVQVGTEGMRKRTEQISDGAENNHYKGEGDETTVFYIKRGLVVRGSDP